MKIEVLDPTKITLDMLVNDMDDLYYIANEPEKRFKSDRNNSLLPPTKLVLMPAKECGMTILNNQDYLVVKITNEDPDYILEPDNVPFPEVLPERKQQLWGPNKPMLTYKFNGSDAHGIISVAFRPENSGIRVSFQDKESAETYLNYFRDQFYMAKSGVDVITVSDIYKDLNIVDWDPELCDDWGWYTLDGGTCKYLTETVTKTKNTKMWGFTFNRPTRLYETRKKEALV